MWLIGQNKNNIANILQLYALTKKKKKNTASKTMKVEQTKTTITKLL